MSKTEGKKMSQLGSEQRSSSDEDRSSVSDLRKLMEKQYGDIMSAILEVNCRVMKLECGMERLSIGMKSDTIEVKTHSSGPRCLKLVFNNKISLPVLSGEEIKGEGGKYLEIALVDDISGNVVDFGREASAHVEIVALEGDCDDCERDTWVIGNYKNKISTVSEEKMSVLVGKVKVKLNKGIGSLATIKFRNSSNHNSGVFKLGAKVLDTFDGTVVKEAMTESFVVKDFREKYTQKHYPPCLSDEVWRLKNIQKGGAICKRLIKEKVKTVEDFLIQLLKHNAGLKCLLDLPEKRWEATVHHARTCTINQKVYSSINSQENSGIVFNVFGQILGLIKNWNYVHRDALSREDKVDDRNLVEAAFKQEGGVKEFDNEASLLQYLSRQSTAASANSPRQKNTVSFEVETSKSGEYIDASSREILSSKIPHGGSIRQEAETSGVDRFNHPDTSPSNNPTECTGLEAPLYGPRDRYNVDEMNLNSSSQGVLQSKNPSGGAFFQETEESVHEGLDFQKIFPSINPPGGSGLEAPLYTPCIDDQESLDASFLDSVLSWSPTEGGVLNEVKASEPQGFGLQDIFASIHLTGGTPIENFGSDGVKDTEMGTNCFLSSPEQYLPLGPLWVDQDNVQPSSSSLINNGNRPSQKKQRTS